MKLKLLIACLIGFTSYAQELAFDPLESKGQLYEYADLLNTGSSELTVRDVLFNSSLEFKNLESDNHSVGFTTDNFWVRFKLKNSSNRQQTFYLETA
ncbi:MAG: hypothetical protein KDD05_01490, partial [Psychroserpens sp.]|nr:hypothetical protein [Psychroserpens sp.]